MESRVTVLTPNGRRQIIKVSPNTTLLKILEDVCSKHNFDSEEFTLTHHNKEVSLSQPFRFSGLPNNCQLEMAQTDRKRSTAEVEICVQLEDGSRKQGSFQSTDNLLDVMKQLANEELCKYESPVVVYMRQDVMGQENMNATTLKSLGILEGRALLRLANKKIEELKTQAMVYAPPAPKLEKKTDEKDNEKNPKSNKITGGSGGFAITKDLVQSLKKAAATTEDKKSTENEDQPSRSPSTEEQNKEAVKPKYDWGDAPGRSMQASKGNIEPEKEEIVEPEIEPEYHIIGERHALIYSLDAAQSQIEDLPDSFYDLTVNDLKLVLRDLRKIASGDEDAPLLTEKLREIENSNTMLKKISQYKNCVIRIQFPDRHVLQGMFKPIDKVDDIMQFVKAFLKQPEQPCYLFTIPPKNKLDLDKTLLELDFVPNALVHFSPEDETFNGTLVEDAFLKQLSSPEGAFYAASKFRNQLKNTSEERPQLSPSTGAIPKRPRSDQIKN
ncbi:tether containing UBX domain for GLUT4 [Stomoxys calcitrans]|uniref:tether containing UBX domain for GLUT4 n=1 Tax=Stomoxys calcitrans TaxID=35570 RepID=UPI0027E3508E|nr:tether containing UBX domain for GLUT4 [Stomoxys calcitrans]